MRSGITAKQEEFEEIVHRFEIPLLQYARRITGDREQARDVVQETFVKFQRNGALRREDEPATWLFTVCRNAALNVCRKEKRAKASNRCLLTILNKAKRPGSFCALSARCRRGSRK